MTKVGAYHRANDCGIFGRLGRGWRYGRKIYGTSRYGKSEQGLKGKEYGDDPYGIRIYGDVFEDENKDEFGIKLYGDFDYGEDKRIWGIYQRRHNKGKVVYAKMKFYIPSNPRTVPQQNWRAVFGAGMTAWGNLTNEQKEVYNERAKSLHLHGVNLFMREYLKS